MKKIIKDLTKIVAVYCSIMYLSCYLGKNEYPELSEKFYFEPFTLQRDMNIEARKIVKSSDINGNGLISNDELENHLQGYDPLYMVYTEGYTPSVLIFFPNLYKKNYFTCLKHRLSSGNQIDNTDIEILMDSIETQNKNKSIKLSIDDSDLKRACDLDNDGEFSLEESIEIIYGKGPHEIETIGNLPRKR